MNGIFDWGYIVYYVLMPVAMLILGWKLWNNVKLLDVVKDHGWETEKNKEYSKLDKNMKKTLVIFIAFLFILPLWGFSTSSMAEFHIHRERVGGGLFNPNIIDPVIHSMGPSYDTDHIIEQMEQDPDRWLIEELDERIDFDELTSFPGRLAVYRLSRGIFGPRMIITYTYVSPIPIMRAYGFQYEIVDDEIVFMVEREKTYVFPMIVTDAGDIADF